MRVFIDFETANDSYLPYQVGVVAQNGDMINETLDVDERDWSKNKITFNFHKRGLSFNDYLSKKSIYPVFEEIEEHLVSLFDGNEVMAWYPSTERHVLAFYGYHVEIFSVDALARKIFGSRERGFYKLGNIARFLNIEVNEDQEHNAYYDAYLTSKVYEVLSQYVTGEEEIIVGIELFSGQPITKKVVDVDRAQHISNSQYEAVKAASLSKINLDFTGRVVSASGKFPLHTKQEIFDKIEELGGTASKTVTKKVNMLVVADTGIHGETAKIKKAKEQGIEILGVDELFSNSL
ncbi:BRCT domain-containing protein [Vibrio lentus]|uniref:BRCT domain-containing protein n=1 Tax=Vibrio lentus TaxID=136468 RepID=A0A2N7IDN9_9VIBR|nr:BRCT domain-containing protein [Vibrio lentus]PML55058.1 hypothetical protein BCT74_06925 [Vibrio lentus]